MGYDFWADHKIETDEKKWRACLGTSEVCAKKVFGTKYDRRCNACQKNVDAAEYGGERKTERRGRKLAKVPRPFRGTDY